MPAYQFLDSTADELIRDNHGIRVYCKCGNHVLLTPASTFAPMRHLTLHQIVARLRCQRCGRLGDCEAVHVAPMNSPYQGLT